ncbi:hypothetical protein J2Y60_004034 [Arcicella sp. BE140]|nr:hypothetical protein [Arcicella sp. BE140]MDR6564069.1 hypothetical protein [Arcicella sp. BE51]MDR6813822.1 hypothetical protein [Arcicella sp. BE140]MDR6825134.1 hypothetical protein [Arcicella sp. BE139]
MSGFYSKSISKNNFQGKPKKIKRLVAVALAVTVFLFSDKIA